MSIGLLALDLDGTLLNPRGELTDRNRRAVALVRELGVRVALVTGRRFRDARPLALELDLDVPVIAHNGALTKHARTLEIVEALLLPLPAAREVLRVGRSFGADALVSDDPVGPGLLIYDHVSADNPALARYIEWSRRIHGQEAVDAIRQVASIDDYLDHPPVHISFSGTCRKMSRLRDILQEEVGPAVKVLLTLYPRQDFALLDVLHPRASKGVGVAAAAAEYGLVPAEVMAIGDNLNDLEMLEFAGTPVLMKNAEASLRLVEGFHLTESNEEDGVAVAIERFILNDGLQPRAGASQR